MVFQVIEELHDSCRILTAFGTRSMAEEFIRKFRPVAKIKKLTIKEVSLPDGHPAMNFPFLPGKGQ